PPGSRAPPKDNLGARRRELESLAPGSWLPVPRRIAGLLCHALDRRDAIRFGMLIHIEPIAVGIALIRRRELDGSVNRLHGRLEVAGTSLCGGKRVEAYGIFLAAQLHGRFGPLKC